MPAGVRPRTVGAPRVDLGGGRRIGDDGAVVALIIGLLVCVGVAVLVVGLVAIPARREGRDVLTTRGEDLVASLRDRDKDAAPAAGPEDASTTPEPSTPSEGPARPESS